MRFKQKDITKQEIHLLPLKTGLLKILAKISDKTEMPIALVPVSIGYDRSCDLESYIPYLKNDNEKKNKKKQSILNFILKRWKDPV